MLQILLLFFAFFVWFNHFVICIRCWKKDVMQICIATIVRYFYIVINAVVDK